MHLNTEQLALFILVAASTWLHMGTETHNERDSGSIFIMAKILSSFSYRRNLNYFGHYEIILHVVMKHLWWFQVCSAQVSKNYAALLKSKEIVHLKKSSIIHDILVI